MRCNERLNEFEANVADVNTATVCDQREVIFPAATSSTVQVDFK